MTRFLNIFVVLAACMYTCPSAWAADQASGAVKVDKVGTITASHAVAYRVRDQRDARATQIEIMLTDVALDGAPLQAALDPHMIAINLDALKDRNYIVLALSGDGSLWMNATFSKTMTQFIDATTQDLKVTWTTNTPTRLDGRLVTPSPIKLKDGTSYTVELKFAVDVPAAPTGTALPAGGGDAGKALIAFVAAAQRKNWPVIKAGSSPDALKMFDKDYNTPAENAANAADLLKAWIPTTKMKVAGGQLRGETAILDVEGEMFPGMSGLSLVQMVKSGAVWKFDRAVRAGMLPSK